MPDMPRMPCRRVARGGDGARRLLGVLHEGEQQRRRPGVEHALDGRPHRSRARAPPGTMRVLPSACSRCTIGIRSSGECSMSTTPQSKPAWPSASATIGLVELIQVPIGAWLPAARSSCTKRVHRELLLGAACSLSPQPRSPHSGAFR